jgi:hypothetical protein
MNELNKYLFEYDFDFLHVCREFKISEKYSIENYLYGRCHIFALALSEHTNFKVGALIDNEPFHDTNGFPCLEHAFCYFNDDLIIDARGIKSKKEILQEYCSESNDIIEIKDAKELLQDWIQQKLLIKATKNELKDLDIYIEKMKNSNVLKPLNLIEIPPSQNIKLKI